MSALPPKPFSRAHYMGVVDASRDAINESRELLRRSGEFLKTIRGSRPTPPEPADGGDGPADAPSDAEAKTRGG